MSRVLRALSLLLLCASFGVPSPAAHAAAVWARIYTREAAARGPVIDVRAVGDVMLGRRVAAVGNQRGWERLFARVAARSTSALLGGDLTLGNLESPLSDRQADPKNPLQLIGSLEAAPALAAAGFDALSLANNHAYDDGTHGLQQTAAALKRVKIDAIGIGAQSRDALMPFQSKLNGLDVAVLAANDIAGTFDPVPGAKVWQRGQLDDVFLATVRATARTADLTIIMVHWGEEYISAPTQRQQTWARQLIVAGADLIIGAHPHILQPYAVVDAGGRRGVVLYSLGNLLFDQLTRWETSSGAIARIVLDRDGVAVLEAAPVDMVGWQITPLPIDSQEGQGVLSALGAQQPTGTTAAPHPSLQAWSWNGKTVHPLVVPRRTNPIIHPQTLYADLRGDGEQQLIRLERRVVTVHAGPDESDPVVWNSSIYGWPITRIIAGDPNNDGRLEILMLVHKPDNAGSVRVHPYLLGYRGKTYKIIWGGSPRPTDIRDAAIGDFDGDHTNELVFLEGGATFAAPATAVVIFRWHSWFFYEEARLPDGTWYTVDARDINRDGRVDLLVDTEPPMDPEA